MESINRPIFAPFSILLHLVRSDLHPENRGLCQSRLRLCIYIERYHFVHFLSSWNILEFSQVKCQLFRTIFMWNFFSDHQSRERRLEGLCFIKYIGNLFENYAIRGI